MTIFLSAVVARSIPEMIAAAPSMSSAEAALMMTYIRSRESQKAEDQLEDVQNGRQPHPR